MTSPISCPGCNTPMVRENFASAMIDVCVDGCYGLWFDANELVKLDHHKKGFGSALERAVNQPFSPPGDPEPRSCPHCHTPMDVVQYQLAQQVTVDECPTCDGVYLDAFELAQIRNRPMTESERAKARGRRRRRNKRFNKRREERESTNVMLVMIAVMK